MIELIAILTLALAVIAYALMPGRAHRRPPLPVRNVWNGDAQQWTVAPDAAPTPVTALIDLAPGIDLGLRDDCELLWSMPAYQRQADHTTTTTEGDS